MEREIIPTLPSPCATCRNLEYDLFESGDAYGCDDTGPNPTRYLTLEFQDLSASAEKGCCTCDLINRGTLLFWGEYPEECDASDNDDDELYRLCLERRPGKSFTVFRFMYQPWVTEVRMRVEFFTENGTTSSHEAFGHAKAVKRHHSIESATEMIGSWLKTCEQTHSSCRAAQSYLPNRVLNIAGELPKLVETNGTIKGKYITLSHCWGQDPRIQPTVTTLDNVRNRREGIPLVQLCTLFKDFIDLAHHLECEFVWIDSLCIVQDDHEDWIKESGKMADVYSDALLNVAATSSPDSSHGLFVERRTSSFLDDPSGPLNIHKLKFGADQSGTVCIRASHRKDHKFFSDRVINGRWEDAPLLTRAWVLQERLLARRTINFCRSELIWECEELCACECTGLDVHLNHQTKDLGLQPYDTGATTTSREHSTLKYLFSQLRQGTLSHQRAYEFWLEVVGEYSVLHLSKPWDRYQAVAGIADIFKRTIKDRCVAGIWENDMARGLAWYGGSRSSSDYSRSFIAPTWSWMSRIQEQHGQFDSYMGYFDVKNFVCDRRFAASYSVSGSYSSSGLCKDNILNLTGAVIPARISIDCIIRLEYYINLQQNTQTKQSFLMWADRPGPSGDNLGEKDECLCLLLGTNPGTSDAFDDHVVVLRKCSDTDGGYFERIGITEIQWHEESLFEDAEVRTLSVV